jgi:hypothetical protein
MVKRRRARGTQLWLTAQKNSFNTGGSVSVKDSVCWVGIRSRLG